MAVFNIYIADYSNSVYIGSKANKTLIQSVPAGSQDQIYLTGPSVQGEMGNAGSCTFGVEGGSPYYDSFEQLKTYIQVDYDDTTIFYGRVVTISTDFFGTRRITCEGPLAFFNDNFMQGKKTADRKKQSALDWMKEIIKDYNDRIKDPKRHFVIGEVPGNYSSSVKPEQKVKTTNYKYGNDSWTDTKSALEDLRSHYGGYFRTRLTKDGIALDWMDQYFNADTNTQSIQVGKNVLDLSVSTEVENIFTVLIPIGKATKSTSTSSSTGGSGSVDVYLDSDKSVSKKKEILVREICDVYGGPYSRSNLNNGYHQYDDYLNSLDNYGRIIKTVTFDDASTAKKLKSKAQEWIKNNYQGRVSKFTVRAVDLHQLGDNSLSKLMVGDKVKLVYPTGTPNQEGVATWNTVEQTCLNITYDLYNPENNQYTFGIPANILTQSYGVFKQANSVKSNPTSPKDSGGGDDVDPNWFNSVKSWLINHMIRYKGKKPYKEGYEGQCGISGTLISDPRNYFYDTTGYMASGSHAMYFFTKTGVKYAAGYSEQQYQKIKAISEAAAKQYRDSFGYGFTWNWVQQSLDGPLTTAILKDSDAINYIYDEYGINLLNNCDGYKGPSSLTGSDGSTTTYATDPDGKPISKEYIDEHGVKIVTPDGRTVTSLQDANGDWHYYQIDADGNVTETNIRDLAITVLNDETHFGALVKGGFIKKVHEDGTVEYIPHDYAFGIAVEKYAGGELVVSRIDGDVVYIGSEATQYASLVAQKRMISIAGSYEMRPDENGVPQVFIKSGGGMRVLKGRRDENGNFITDDDGNVQYADFGVYDDDNLTGGIMVQKINDETVTKINGNIIQLGDENTMEIVITAQHLTKFGIIDPKTGTLTAGIISKLINDQDPNSETITYISGDYIKIGEREDGGITKSITITSSDELSMGLVRLGDDGTPILNGGLEAGAKIYRKNKDGVVVGYGIWDESGENVDGGILVNKMQGKVVTTINGTEIKVGTENTVDIEITAKHLAGLNVWTDGNSSGKAGLMIEAINATTSEARINTDRLIFTGSSVNLSDKVKIKANEDSSGQHSIWLDDSHVYIGNGNILNLITMVDGVVTAKNFRYKEYDDDGGSLVKSMLKDAVVDETNHTLTISRFDGTEVTFSKAVTLGGTWSNGVLDIKATPQDVHYYVGFETGSNESKDQNLYIESNGNATLAPVIGTNAGKFVDQNIDIVRYVFGASQPETTVVHSRKTAMRINATPAWEEGQKSGWDLARTYLSNPGAPDPIPEDDLTEKFKVGIPGSEFNKGNEYWFELDADDDYVYAKNSLKRVIARKSNPGMKKGWEMATDPEMLILPKEEPEDLSTLEQLIRVYAPMEDGVGVQGSYYYYVTVEKDIAYIRYGSKTGPRLASVGHSWYSEGWKAASRLVDMPEAEVAEADLTQQILVSYPTKDAVDGAASGRTYKLVDAAKNYSDLQTYTSAGYKPVARLTHNRYDSGWKAASRLVDMPEAEVAEADLTQQILVSYPTKDAVDGAASGRTYKLIDAAKNYSDLQTYTSAGYKPVARLTHNRYDSGWKAASRLVDMPEAEVAEADLTQQILVSYPTKDAVDGAASGRTYKLIDAAKNYSDLQTYTSAGYKPVARLTHNRYDSGWKAASRLVDMPEAEVAEADLTQQILVSYPTKDAVDGAASGRTYKLIDAAKNYSDLQTYTSAGYKPVARLTHNRYDSGWKAASRLVDMPEAEVAEADLTQQILVSYPTKDAVDGAASGRTYKLVDAAKNYSDLQTYTSAGYKPVARLTHNRYDSGWKAASRLVDMPEAEVAEADLTQQILVSYPTKDAVDGAASGRTYKLIDAAKNYSDLQTYTSAGYKPVARLTHNRYDSGWKAASRLVDMPEAEVAEADLTQQILVSYPTKDAVDGAASGRTYKLVDAAKNYSDLQTYTSAGYKPVARLTHNRYDSGWKAASRLVDMPEAEVAEADLTQQILVSYPTKDAVDGAASGRTYKLVDAAKNYSDLQTYTSAGYKPVARLTHNRYDSGWNGAVKELTITDQDDLVKDSSLERDTFQIKVPKKGGSGTNTLTFKVNEPTPSSEGTVSVTVSGYLQDDLLYNYKAARIKVGDWYTAGQNAVSVTYGWTEANPSLTYANQYTVKRGDVTVDEFIIEASATVHADKDKYIIQAKKSDGTILYQTTTNTNVYVNGWNAGIAARVRTTGDAGDQDIVIKKLEYDQKWTITDTFRNPDNTGHSVVKYTVLAPSDRYNTGYDARHSMSAVQKNTDGTYTIVTSVSTASSITLYPSFLQTDGTTRQTGTGVTITADHSGYYTATQYNNNFNNGYDAGHEMDIVRSVNGNDTEVGTPLSVKSSVTLFPSFVKKDGTRQVGDGIEIKADHSDYSATPTAVTVGDRSGSTMSYYLNVKSGNAIIAQNLLTDLTTVFNAARTGYGYNPMINYRVNTPATGGRNIAATTHYGDLGYGQYVDIAIRDGVSNALNYLDYSWRTPLLPFPQLVYFGSGAAGVAAAQQLSVQYNAGIYNGDLLADGWYYTQNTNPENNGFMSMGMIYHVAAAPAATTATHSLTKGSLSGPFATVKAFREAVSVTSSNAISVGETASDNQYYGFTVTCGDSTKGYYWKSKLTVTAESHHSRGTDWYCTKTTSGDETYYTLTRTVKKGKTIAGLTVNGYNEVFT